MPKETLYWNTVTPLLQSILYELMASEYFVPFRLVGGTSLSLQLGHRASVDIDLFTDAEYGAIDFHAIEQYLLKTFPYVSGTGSGIIGIGNSYAVGSDAEQCIKLDLYYTDPFIRPPIEKEGIRLATVEEIIAMKMDVVQRGGRKKDFWDLHEVISGFPPTMMIALHEQRYPYTHDEQRIRKKFTDFSLADDDFEPICLRGKYWELIKLDLITAMQP